MKCTASFILPEGMVARHIYASTKGNFFIPVSLRYSENFIAISSMISLSFCSNSMVGNRSV